MTPLKKRNAVTDAQIQQNTEIALSFLKEGRIADALEYFNEILDYDYNNQTAETGAKISKWWLPRLNNQPSETPYQKVRYLYDEWRKFESYLDSQKNISMKSVNSLMFFIFNTSLQYLKKDIQDNKIIDIPVLYMTGLAYKKIGDFSNAVIYFEKVIRNDRYNAEAFAQLADCYALIDEERKAKVLFREAFFIDPFSVRLEFLDSNIILHLLVVLKNEKIPKEEFSFWLPVYGRVLNIFNVIRDLLPVEVGKIRQEIFQLEQEIYKAGLQNNEIGTARLINYYLWLYDYYINKKTGTENAFELEEKIKNLSIRIYSLLKNNITQEIK